MSEKNIFLTTKGYYETALDNLELYQKNSGQILKIFMEQQNDMSNDFVKQYNEWVANCQKGFNDYRKIILDGLDFLANSIEKK